MYRPCSSDGGASVERFADERASQLLKAGNRAVERLTVVPASMCLRYGPSR